VSGRSEAAQTWRACGKELSVDLPDNVIRLFLQNVYFVSGCACGGKTTISRYLADKHRLFLYNWDERFDSHKAMSDPEHQPFMHRSWPSWESYFNRPPMQYAHDLRQSILEQVNVAVVELISLSGKERGIVVDGIFPPAVLNAISCRERVVYLLAEPETIRAEYFNRSDKQVILECIRALRDPESSMQNVFLSMECWMNGEIPKIDQSGFRSFTRGRRTDWERVRREVENHFGLCR
jgi:hypothetical protein